MRLYLRTSFRWVPWICIQSPSGAFTVLMGLVYFSSCGIWMFICCVALVGLKDFVREMYHLNKPFLRKDNVTAWIVFRGYKRKWENWLESGLSFANICVYVCVYVCSTNTQCLPKKALARPLLVKLPFFSLKSWLSVSWVWVGLWPSFLKRLSLKALSVHDYTCTHMCAHIHLHICISPSPHSLAQGETPV